MSMILGQGRLIVASSASPGSDRQFGFQISKETILFYDLAGGAAISGLEWWSQVQSDLLAPGAGGELVLVPGHVVLSALPATPEAAFFEIAVGSGGDSSFSLNIRQPNVFGKTQGGQGEFRNLNLVFTQAATGVTVSGNVELLLFDAPVSSVRLAPVLSNEGLLTFETTEGQVSIAAVGALNGATVKTAAEAHPWEDLQLLYSFEAQSLQADTIQDVTDKAPIGLSVQAPTQVAAVEQGLAVTATKETGIATASIDTASPVEGERPVDRLTQACQATNKLSVVLWIKPDNITQNGPARIFTLSTDHSGRNLMVGQEKDRYVVRLRTFFPEQPRKDQRLSGNINGRIQDKEPLGSKMRVQTEPTCVVLTWAPAATDDEENAHLYINGEQVDSRHMKGDFRAWETFELAIANEFNNKTKPKDRHWSGTFYRIELYNQALTESQVRQLYYPKLAPTVGDLVFDSLPKPFDQAVAEATLTYEANHSLLKASVSAPRQATPHLRFDQILLTWKKQQEPWVLEPDSKINATLWQQNSLELKTRADTPPAEFLPLVPAAGNLTLALNGLGEISVRDVELRPGSFNGRPQWQLAATVEEPHLTLPPISRDFDFKTDFRLLAPQLLIGEMEDIADDPTEATPDRVLLRGEWLGQTLDFYGVSLGERFLLRATTRFELPFSLTLGPICLPGSTTQLADQITMCPTPGCRQIMGLDTLVELSAAGFIATVNGNFTWEDGFGPGQEIAIPEFTTFELPTRPNDLLAQALAQLERYKNEIFSPVLRSLQDFYVVEDTPGVVEDIPEVGLLVGYGSLKAPDPAQPAIETEIPGPGELPQVEDGADSSPRRFTLEPLPGKGLRLSVAQGTLSTLPDEYQRFLKNVSAQLSAAEFNVVRQRLAERLPVPVSSALSYAYGYANGQTIDLVGGMRLRVEYQNYQFVHPLDKTAETGFVSSGMAYYSLHFNEAEGFLGFDPFMADMPTQVNSNNSSVAGLTDLLQAGLRRPFYRLLYPDRFAPSDGRVGSERAAVLIGADTYARLDQAATSYLNTQTVPNTDDVDVVHFRGRAVVIPEIAVFVQDQPLYVAVGTTLKQIAERYGAAALRGRPQRLVHEGVDNRAAYRFINLGDSPKALDLPVVQGDRLYF